MPTYDYRCTVCEKPLPDHFRHISEPDPFCCGVPMQQEFNTPWMFNNAFLGSTRNPGYQCLVTDQYIESKKARREVMARHNLVEHPEPLRPWNEP